VSWLVEFYAAWSPQCAQFAPAFSELSAKYALFFLFIKSYLKYMGDRQMDIQ